MVEVQKIAVCSYHKDRELTPLIWTFAFPYKEWRCPACGRTYGMMGTDDAIKTLTLAKRHRRYIENTKWFIRSVSTLNCSAMMIKGKKVNRDDIPDSMIKYHTKRKEKYKYKISRSFL